MTLKQRYQTAIEYFKGKYRDAETELVYDDPYQLLVAVILSAQCTDKRVNQVTPPLFGRYTDVFSLSKAEINEVYEFIRSVSYPNSKAKYLVGMAKMVVQNHGGHIPMTVEELVELPGVGRKTANVITSVIDQQPNMAVDTHVFRVSARIGLTRGATTPLAVEKQLISNIPEEYVHKAHHWLILHGRYICVARSPKCHLCGLTAICKYFLQQEKIKS
jgi:endonuclease III